MVASQAVLDKPGTQSVTTYDAIIIGAGLHWEICLPRWGVVR